MIQEGHIEFGLGFDFLVQLLVLAVLTAVAAKLYPIIIR